MQSEEDGALLSLPREASKNGARENGRNGDANMAHKEIATGGSERTFPLRLTRSEQAAK